MYPTHAPCYLKKLAPLKAAAMLVIRLRNTVVNIMIICIFLCIFSFITTKLLTLLPAVMQPSVFMLLCMVYWLMIDNITFSTDLMAAETRSLMHREAERTATKIAVAAVAAAADSAKQKKEHTRHEQLFRKRAASFIA